VPEGQPAPMKFASYVDDEGNLADGWHGILDEDLREEEPTLSRIKNIRTLAKSMVQARKMIGKDHIPKPNENSTDAEWEAYYKAGGMPETAADYNITRPDDFPEEMFDPQKAVEATELFHKLGLSTKQANALYEWDLARTKAGYEKMQQAEADARESATANLMKEWGQAYEQKKHLGNVALEQAAGGDEGFKARIVNKYGNDPDFIKIMANLGGKFAEHGDVQIAMIPTPMDLKDQIREFESENSAALMNAGDPRHNKVLEQRNRMYQALAKAENRA